MSNISLAILSARDQIIEEAIETNLLVLEAKAWRKRTHFILKFSAFLVSTCIIAVFSVFIWLLAGNLSALIFGVSGVLVSLPACYF